MKLKNILLSLASFLPVVSCNAGSSPEMSSVSSLFIYGEAAEGLTQARKAALSKVYDGGNNAVAGVFETYLNFSEGGFSVVDAEGNAWTLSEGGKVTKDGGESVLSGESGVCRLRIDTSTGLWSLVKVNAVTFRSFYGDRVSVEGEYSGLGKWKFYRNHLNKNISKLIY